MAKVFLICGKICSGKTRYAQKLVDDHYAVILSCDEIEYELFHHQLGEKYDEVIKDIKKYLHKKASEIVRAGCNVILAWGFWTSEERQRVAEYYQRQSIAYEWHYVEIAKDDWHQNIKARNEAVLAGKTTDYFVDESLLAKMEGRFESPNREEVDVWYLNKRG